MPSDSFGMAVLSSLLHATTFSRPFLSTLVPSVALAFTLQGAVAIPSILAQSEKFYDLSGSFTYVSCVGLSLLLPTIRARYAAAAAGAVKPAWPSVIGALRGASGAGLNWRQVLLSAAVGVWATRRMSPEQFCKHYLSADDSISTFSGFLSLCSHFRRRQRLSL